MGQYHKRKADGTYAQYVHSTNSIATKAKAVVPSDTTDLSDGVTTGLYVGGAGNLAVTMEDGSAITFTGVTAGTIYPIAVKRVKATGTTATNLVAVY